MNETRAASLYRLLAGLTRGEATGGLPDAELLSRFLAARDEAAFELLVWRHGAMVLGLCRRVLRHEQDAEDAFQATFLILSRKAGSIGRRENVAAWLYKVAYRVALRARAATMRRRTREATGATPDSLAATADSPPAPPLRSELDEEIARLPERYRRPFVLCYLEERSPQEAARELNLTVATLYARLSRARRRLRDRLSRRSPAAPPGVPLILPAVLPGPLAGAAARSAARVVAGGAPDVSANALTLTKGVIRAMFIERVKWGAALLALVLLAAAGTAVPLLAARERPAAPVGRTDDNPKADEKGETKKPPPLKIAVDVPKDLPTKAQVNSGEYTLKVRLENVGKDDLILWPYLLATLHDPDGKEVEVSRFIGRFDLGKLGKSFLEDTEFITLKPGATHEFTVSVPSYDHHPTAMMGWKLPAAGEYRFDFKYYYNRAAARRDYGKNGTNLDDPKAPWNRAYETDQKFEAKIKVK
jgi:RNA polymerase sigma factor (sigma-70 family)